MPDKYGFDHLGPHHRCVEEGCGWPGHYKIVSEHDRARHARTHERQRAKEAKAKQQANLALARRVKRQKDRENNAAYRQEGDE